MIVNELRIMSGPNMWSPVHHLLVFKMGEDVDQLSDTEIENISVWVRENQLTGPLPGKSKQQFLTAVLANLTKTLQPESVNLFSDVQRLGPKALYGIVQYYEENTGVEAFDSAQKIITDLISNQKPEALDITKTRIAEIHKKEFLGPSTSTIVQAAVKQNIPVRKSHGGFIVFGQGKHQKKISASISEHTSDISVDIAGDKEITKRILEDAMIPVPKGHLIYEETSLEALMSKLDYPVVVKPLNANKGKGITSNIYTPEEIKSAFSFAKTFSKAVIIEKHITGNDYRFLVVGNKLVAAAQRTPACVTGDGHSTITQLVDKVNADPLRGAGHGKVLTAIVIDESTLNILKAENLTPDSVIPEGRIVYLKDTANLSTGGTAIDITDKVHPDNVILAERVAALIGLDICGIDIMAPDVASPITQNGGAVLEVNAAPGLRMHVSPSGGTPRNVGEPIIKMMFPAGNARIPIVAITGTNGKTTTVRLMSHLASGQGYNVGFTTTDGIYLNTTRIYKGDCSGPQSAKVILQEPTVDFAVLECARGGIIRSGLAFDQCDIGIVTNVAADHLGLKDIYTIEDLARVKAVVPGSVSPSGYAILNAADELVYNMRNDLKCKVALFCKDFSNPHIIEHYMAGGIAAVLNEYNDIIIIKHNKETKIMNVQDIPLSMDGKADFMIENILSVVLAAYLLNFSIEQIKSSLTAFKPSEEQTPGRLNKFEINGVNVILDYAHNPHGLKALGGYLNNLGTVVTGIVAGVGDRRDEDLIEVGRTAAAMYDRVIIRSDKDTRGRTPEEIARLIVLGLTEADPRFKYKIINDSEEALTTAIEKSEKDAYVVISADDTNDTLDIIHKLENKYNNS